MPLPPRLTIISLGGVQVHDGVVLPDAIADDTWRVNLKGLWNVLDVAQRSETVERVVHVGERPVLRSSAPVVAAAIDH